MTPESFAACALDAFETDIRNDLAGRVKPYTTLELEVGSGNGKFLVEHALERPDVFFIGLEWSLKAINKSIIKAYKRSLKNLVFIHGEAVAVITDVLLNTYTFDTVYLNFPDPWPKKRHNKRRIVSDEFVASVRNLLADNGRFFLVTDDEEYATTVMAPVMERSAFNNTLSTPWAHELQEYKQTLYEHKMRSAGKNIYYFSYVK
ncbi:MAG: tRNA (guanosine(46)-N7)-methyltransferase TrmB [Spirochaetes bacterium]|nr:tRNA (guanosine(46)-N7)-methyltransferase TrmB [Spirochaetota bacterium]